ncbi:MAG: hypothetical protein N2504_04975 [candidate division WOR-3 bacterium]|nr:hypothetical protein [candidate division WOR-3 bacterium]
MNLLGNNDLGYRGFIEFFSNAYANSNIELNLYSRVYFGRKDFPFISPSHFSFFWEGFYYYRKFFIYYIHNCENGIDKNAFDNRRWDFLGLGFDYKNLKLILGHVVSPFRTSYDNQDYGLIFNIKGQYGVILFNYFLILDRKNSLRNLFSLKFNYPIYIGYERRIDMYSMKKQDERNLYFLGFGLTDNFKVFRFYNLFRLNHLSYNVLYISEFGYSFLKFNIDGLSADNRWTPGSVVFKVFLGKGFSLSWFSKHFIDLNYLKDRVYEFDYTNKFPYALSIGYKDENFGFFYSIFSRSAKTLSVYLSFKYFSYTLYFDENFNFSDEYYIYYGYSFSKGVKLVLGIFKNYYLEFNNIFLGIMLSNQ